MSVPQETMAELEAERQKLLSQQEEQNDPPEGEQEGETEDEGKQEDEPNTQDPDLEGFMTYEEYVEAGYDPEFYRGPKAYKQQKQILAEKKQVEQKLKQIDDQMLKLTKFHEKEKERLLKDLEAQKKQAREDMDVERLEELYKQERELEKEDESEQGQGGDHPLIAEFRKENPKYDPRSPEFDPVDTAAFQAALNTAAAHEERALGRVLTDDEVVRILRRTQQRFEGNAPQRQTPKARVEAPKRKPKKESPMDKLPPEVKGLYEKWAKSKDPEKQAWAKQLLEKEGA